jgi:hypothetical protein
MEAWKATNDYWPHLLWPIKRQVATAERSAASVPLRVQASPLTPGLSYRFTSRDESLCGVSPAPLQHPRYQPDSPGSPSRPRPDWPRCTRHPQVPALGTEVPVVQRSGVVAHQAVANSDEKIAIVCNLCNPTNFCGGYRGYNFALQLGEQIIKRHARRSAHRPGLRTREQFDRQSSPVWLACRPRPAWG